VTSISKSGLGVSRLAFIFIFVKTSQGFLGFDPSLMRILLSKMVKREQTLTADFNTLN
jgi:hypothetical protein